MENSHLVWMDLEMTGLEPQHDTILEIATIVTDIHLNIIEYGPEIAIYQNEDVIQGMNEWCQVHHRESGLVDRVRASKISLAEAEQQTLEFIQKHVEKGMAPLCGNSIHQDRSFLAAYMPDLHAHFHYRNIDVSTIKELVYRWYPNLEKFQKQGKHTALEDIKESIKELVYYKKHIFVPVA